MTKIYLGGHTSIKNGVLNGLKYIQSIGGNVSQIFLGNKLSSQLKHKTKISDQEAKEIKEWLKKNDHILVVHASYVLNLCSKPPTSRAIQYQLDSLKYDLDLGCKLGFNGLVVHIGNQLNLDTEEVYQNMALNIQKVIDDSIGGCKILLETPAGQGTQIATSLETLSKLWNLFPKKYHSRLGICVDTAHVFSSGYDINDSKGVKNYFKKFNKLIGLKYLDLVHLNDSKVPLNSRKDRHQKLTEGYIFGKEFGGSPDALKEIMKFTAKHKIPALFETPGDGSSDSPDAGSYQFQIQMIQNLVPEYKHLPKSTINLTNQYLLKMSKKTHKKTKKTQRKDQTQKKDKSEVQDGGASSYSSKEPNKTIIFLLSQLGNLYRKHGDTFRSRAYLNASMILREYKNKIKSIDDVKNLSGIGKGIQDKIKEILETNKLEELEELKKKTEPRHQITLQEELESVLGIGSQQAKKLIKDGVKSFDDFIKKVKEGTIQLNNQQMVGVKYYDDLKKLIPRKDAHDIVLKIKKAIHQNQKWKNIEVIHAGSYPSGKVASKDIDVLLFDPRIKTREDLNNSNLLFDILDHLEKKGLILEKLSLGKTKFLGLVPGTPKSNFAKHLDIRLIPTESKVYAYFYYTSGGKFNQMIRQIAKNKGFRLSEFEMTDQNGNPVKVQNEAEIFKKIGIDYIPMADRRKI